MAKTELAKTRAEIILPTERVEYKEITEARVVELVAKAKKAKELKAGLPTPDSIEYYGVDEQLEAGQKVRFTYLATTIEERVNEETGEVTMLPVAVVIDEGGKFWKNAAFMFVRHFAKQISGYQVEMLYRGYRKTQNGNKMQRLEFRPLGQAKAA